MDAQVLIQAGHEGGVRNSGTGTKPTYGAGGIARPERTMTPIVADRATAKLRDAGFTVVRENALFDKRYEVELAVFLHFDGSGTPCASGASVGYPDGSPPGSNKPTAELWKDIYSQYWDFKWMPDNFSSNLRGYYGYSWTSTSVAEMLIEFGEISCPEQDAWLQPRVDEWLGDLVAHFVSEAIGNGEVPDPGPFGTEPDNRIQRLLEAIKATDARQAKQIARLEKLLS